MERIVPRKAFILYVSMYLKRCGEFSSSQTQPANRGIQPGVEDVYRVQVFRLRCA